MLGIVSFWLLLTNVARRVQRVLQRERLASRGDGIVSYETIEGGLVPVKAWVHGVPIEDVARKQLVETASLPIVWPHVAVMPDVHWGMGATVGSVVPTRGAIAEAARDRLKRGDM